MMFEEVTIKLHPPLRREAGQQTTTDRMASEISSNLAHAKDEIIRAAITHHIGEGWSPDQLIGRAEHLVKQSKIETFSIDGVELVSFTPPKCSTEGDCIRCSFYYRLHYA